MTGVSVRVHGGCPVWPLALHQLVMARDRQAFVGRHLEWRDFAAVPVGLMSGGGRFLEDVLQGYVVDWANHRVPPGDADCMLAALGSEVCHPRGTGGAITSQR